MTNCGQKDERKKMVKKEKSLEKRILDMPFWYHRIELPDGNVTPGFFPMCADRYGIPDDLTGKRVLDVGAWDGYWTFESLKRGAKEVVAIDDFSDDCGSVIAKGKRYNWDTFDLCREAFGFKFIDKDGRWKNEKGQRCNRLEMSVYDIDSLGHFDIIFCFGVIYHLKYPLLALEKLAAICDEEIYIETASLDDYSPYRNGVGKGYNKNDAVMEFYPTDQLGNNEKNWWAPTLQCLGMMVKSVGFKDIHAWALTGTPKEAAECRGFVYGSKTGTVSENVAKLAVAGDNHKKRQLSVAAVMSVPRLGFLDNSFCAFEGLVPLGIPLLKTQGAFWGQCLERGIQEKIDQDFDAILTIDYDTIFTPNDVQNLVQLMIDHPEADAIIPFQQGRSGMGPLLTIKTKTGQVREIIQRKEFEPDLIKIATGHFGLTLIRTSSLLKLPHPWFKPEPAPNGQWGPGRIDDDIHFWKKMEEHGMNIFSANRVVIGHLELVVTWPDENLVRVYQTMSDYCENGKLKTVWK